MLQHKFGLIKGVNKFAHLQRRQLEKHNPSNRLTIKKYWHRMKQLLKLRHC